MPTFRDSADREWSIKFDGLLLDELRESRGINLADVSGADYGRIENDAGVLTKAVCFLLAEQFKVLPITEKQFAASFTGEAQETALAAIWGAAKVFFRPKQWSALQSNYDQQRQAQEQWAAMRPMLLMLNQPDMPESLKLGIMEALKETMSGMSATDLQALTENQSATGLAEIQSKRASHSPDSVASIRAA